MTMQTSQRNDAAATEDTNVRALYHALLNAWNRRSAKEMAAQFTPDGNMVGFDGSTVNGRAEIEAHLAPIFQDHPTAAYVAKVREVRLLAPNVAILRAVSGMVPPGKSDLNPAVNAIHTLIAVKDAGAWRVALFQNTPAQFHGRPELAQQLTDELRQLL